MNCCCGRGRVAVIVVVVVIRRDCFKLAVVVSVWRGSAGVEYAVVTVQCVFPTAVSCL
jgi:hypothetical protein